MDSRLRGKRAAKQDYWKSALSRDSTMGQGINQCFSVMVTITVRPTMRYWPLTISCEKRPDRSSPTRIAPFSLASLLALASNGSGSTAVSMLKVLATVFSRACGRLDASPD